MNSTLPSHPELTFKRFPPRRGHILFPVDSRGGALAGIAMYPACARRAVWFQKAVYAWTTLFGARLIPWGGKRWKSPVSETTWSRLAAEWRGGVGEFDTFAVSERRPVSRSGFIVLLVRADRPIAFVKVRPDDEGLVRESESLERVANFGPKTFLAPDPLGIGEVDGLSYLIIGPLGSGIHGMARQLDISGIANEISSSLMSMPKPEGTPKNWRPMHGDLTPWNLRVMANGKIGLVDWEYASWGPPLADRVLYQATLAMITGRKPALLDAPEAVEFWRQEIVERHIGHDGKGFRERVVAKIDDLALGTTYSKTPESHPSDDPASVRHP